MRKVKIKCDNVMRQLIEYNLTKVSNFSMPMYKIVSKLVKSNQVFKVNVVITRALVITLLSYHIASNVGLTVGSIHEGLCQLEVSFQRGCKGSDQRPTEK